MCFLHVPYMQWLHFFNFFVPSIPVSSISFWDVSTSLLSIISPSGCILMKYPEIYLMCWFYSGSSLCIVVTILLWSCFYLSAAHLTCNFLLNSQSLFTFGSIISSCIVSTRIFSCFYLLVSSSSCITFSHFISFCTVSSRIVVKLQA